VPSNVPAGDLDPLVLGEDALLLAELENEPGPFSAPLAKFID